MEQTSNAGLPSSQQLRHFSRSTPSLMPSISDRTKNVLFGGLAAGFFIAMIAHDYLQEGISLHPDFNFYVLLTFTEFFFCTLGPAVVHVAGGKPTSALNTTPITSFVKLGATIFLAAALANLSLQFVQYPVKVVFKSGKLIPTMLLATCFKLHKRFSSRDYVAAACLCLGVASFTMASSNNAFGPLLLAGAVLADAFIPNLQQALITRGHKASPEEVMMKTNLIGCIGLFIAAVAYGELGGLIAHLRAYPSTGVLLVAYGSAAAVGVLCYTHIVGKFGGVAAIVVATMRKIVTVGLSFIAYPKPFNTIHLCGALLVLAGVLLGAYDKLFGAQDPHKHSGRMSPRETSAKTETMPGDLMHEGSRAHRRAASEDTASSLSLAEAGKLAT